MTDSNNPIALLTARLALASKGEYTTLREALTNWPRLKENLAQCENCGSVGDREYDMTEVDNLVFWCVDCLNSVTPAEFEERFRIPYPRKH